MKVWQRPEEPIAQQRKHKPMEAKESYRWLERYQEAWKVKQACPATLVVNMADRDGDLQAWLVDAMRREPHQRAEVSIRAKCQRAPRAGGRAAVCMGREAADALFGDPHYRTRSPT